MKDTFYSEAKVVFTGTNVKITNEGWPYLGSATGSSLYVTQFVEEKVKGWSSDVTHFARVTQSQPCKGLASYWVYVSCTVPDIDIFM